MIVVDLVFIVGGGWLNGLMTWLEALNLFWNAGEQVKIPDSGPLPHVPSWLRVLTFEEIERADDACRHFAAHWAWPEWPCMADANIRFALYFRCLFAMEMASQANEEGIAEPHGYDAEMLASPLAHILVQMWSEHGLKWADAVFPEGGKAEDGVSE